MAIVRKGPAGKPATKPIKKEEIVEEEVDLVEEEEEVDEEEVEEEEVVPAKKATPAKKVATPAKKTAAPKKEVKATPAKKVATPAKKTAAPKKEVKSKDFELDLSASKKTKTVDDIQLGKCGSLKKDDFYLLTLETLKEKGINLGSKEKVGKIWSVMEQIILSALYDANTFHFGGRNFNRKAVKARVYNPPIGKSYLVMPHFNMRYSLNEAETVNISGEVDEEGNFIAEDGTIYTPADLERISEEYFEQFKDAE
jgi:hypothetical protein